MGAVLLIFLGYAEVLPGAEDYAAAYEAESRGRHGDAVAAYTAVIDEAGPLKEYAQVRAAVARGRAGDTSGAIAELNAFLANAPDGPWKPLATYELALLHARGGRHGEASQAFRIALNTDSPLWWLDEYRRVAALTQLESPEHARYAFDYFRDVVTTTRYIAPRAQAAQQLANSDDVLDLVVAVDGLLRGREPGAARQLMARLNGRSGLDERTAAAIALMQARLALTDGRLSEAESRLNHISEMPQPPAALANVYLELIKSFVAHRRFDHAEQAADAMRRLFPDTEESGEAWWRIAQGYEKHGDYDTAIAKYRHLVDTFPRHSRAADAAFRIGAVYEEKGRSAPALRAYDAVVETYPNDDVAAEAGVAGARLLENAGHIDGAKERYAKAAHVGLGTFTGHRAQTKLDKLRGEPSGRLPHEPSNGGPLVSPVPGLDRPSNALDAFEEDERIQRMRFFAAHGMPEAEWEVLGLEETLRRSLNPGPLYTAIAQTGTAYSAMQIADDADWGLDEQGVRTTERQRVRFPLAYWPLVRTLAAETGIDPFLILSVARQESTYRPALTSYAGARGVMQVMPATAKWLAGVEEAIPSHAADDLENPQISLRMGAYYLMRMLERSNGDVVYALASYNAGPGNCNKWRRRFGNIPAERFIEQIPFSETKHYVQRVLGFYAAYHSLYDHHILE